MGDGFRRIVSLSPSVTENLFAIGAGGRLVGVTTACDFPEAAGRLPRVGDFRRPSWERILSLRPDAVLVESATLKPADVASIRERAGCRVEVLAPRTVDDVVKNLRQLGQWCGLGRDTASLAGRLEARIAAVGRRVRGGTPPRVFVEVSESPLYAAGPVSFVDDLVRRAGGRNVVEVREPFPMVSAEAVLKARVQVYVVASKAVPGARIQRPLARGARVVAVDPDWLFRPTARLVDGLEALARALRSA
jgi:ABC-type hemin transport system substrate-binding protein